MSYPPQGQNAHHNDPRQYQPRTIAPQVNLDEVVYTAPTLGQYFRSDTRGVPGARRGRWAGVLAFWLGLLSIPMFWVLGVALGLSVFTFVAAAISVVAIFFGLVALVAAIGRVLGFFGIVLALIGNTYVIAWLLTALGT